MNFNKKGVSTLGEFIILIGVILVSALFLLSFQKTTTQETGVAKGMSVKGVGERIAGMMNRVDSSPSYTVQSIRIPKTTVRVENGILTVSRMGETFSESVPMNSKDVLLNDTLKVVIVKQDDKILLKGNVPICNFNFFCEPKECLYDCGDCYGPSSKCVGDGNCTKAIGETCKSSPKDCACDSGKECCPSHPDSDEHSCLNITEKKEKGKKCYCDNQCSDNLKCNPTQKNFNGYDKACCPKGKGWNGNKCVEIQKFKLIIIPANWGSLSDFEEIARANGKWWLSMTYLKNCPEKTELVIVDDKKCNSASTAQILRCAKDWGLIPKDDPTGKYWRVVGLDQYWSKGRGKGGYVKPGFGYNLHNPLVKVAWVTTKFRSRGKKSGSFPHELGHTFGLCGEYCGPGDCDGPVYRCANTNKCPKHCRNINKIPSNPTDPNCAMNNNFPNYYHPPCNNWMKNQGLPIFMKKICK